MGLGFANVRPPTMTAIKTSPTTNNRNWTCWRRAGDVLESDLTETQKSDHPIMPISLISLSVLCVCLLNASGRSDVLLSITTYT